MFTNPGITADLAAQHRRELTAQARACPAGPLNGPPDHPPDRPPRRRVPGGRRTAAVVLMTSPVGNAHFASGASHYAHFASGASHYAHFASGASHYAHFASGASHF